MMPMADPNSENAPVARNSTPNQRPTIACIRCGLDSQERDVVGQVRLAEERRVREHRGEAIVMTVTSTKLNTCSMFAKRHQLCHRAMFAGVVSKM